MTEQVRWWIARGVGAAGFAAVLAGTCLLAGACLPSPAKAAPPREESQPKKPRRSQPARTGQAAPDHTGSIARAAGPAAALLPGAAITAPASINEGSLVPITLPAAPRSRMVACGEAWRNMKMSGSTGDESWRDFALKCLVAKDPPQP